MDVGYVAKQTMLWTLISMFAFVAVQAQQKNETKICNSLDIRNSVEQFERLKDCEVIEGNLQILLIDKAVPADYQNLHFPKLREITGHFLLFRVSNLYTLSHIFPNLAVIRGDTLFSNYALVIYEMLELQEIGLLSLVSIPRGGVRIEKNPNLCYLSKIDWSLILQDGVEGNFIKENKDQGDCLNFCPEDVYGERTCRRHGVEQELCWTQDSCQIECPVQCPSACYKDTRTCCHEQCIGGCDGPTERDCVACRNLVVNKTCTDKCPAGTYKYLDRRCIRPEECPQNWTLFNGICDDNCPIGFTRNTTNPRQCQPCDGPCPKVCEGIDINSVAAAAQFAGCTKVMGTLSISIHGASNNNIMKELEDSLGMLEEITGALEVRKAASISSLNFLKSLRIVRGDYLINGKYAIYVMDNRNLQHLFHWDTHPNISVSGLGKLFFHFNPKLCMSEINKLNRRIGRNNSFDHTDINPSTNGDQVACSTDRLEVQQRVFGTIVLLGWSTDDVELGDQRNLLGFMVQWKESPNMDVKEFEGEDTCGSTSWESQFVSPDENQVAILNLRSYTIYAFLVRSYTISSTNYGAKSEIMYIRTSESEPTTPEKLNVYSTSSTNLTVMWSPPEHPNGIITHYVIRWQKQSLDREQFLSRDFCREKPPTLKKSGRVEDQEQEEEENNITVPTIPGCCGCPKSAEELRKEEEEARSQREFENELHNSVYIKRPDARRRRRDVPENENANDGVTGGKNGNGNTTIISVPTSANTTKPPVLNTSTPIQNPFYTERVNVTNPDDDASIELANLEHFVEYRIEVFACHNAECGKKSVIFGRTIPELEADSITDVSIAELSSDPKDRRVLISWKEPPNPNGIVIIYEVEYAKIDDSYFTKKEVTALPVVENEDTLGNGMTSSDDHQMVECVNINEYQRYRGYELANMEPGNYTARIRAITLAGSGPRTESKIFQVPDFLANPTPSPGTGMGAMGTTIAVCVVLVAVLVLFVVFFIRWQYKKDHMPDGVLYASVNPEYMSTNDMYVADEWEFPRDHLEIIHELGKGSFGMVYEGLAKGILPDEPISKVAVKSVQANASIRDRIEFLNEASVMKSITAHHVVRLLGVVSKGQPTYVIMEFMAQGDLKNWLRARRPENQADLPLNERKYPPTLEEIVNMSAEVADGMAFLAAHKYVHRDLSARNCLVSEEGTCKVADFGLARDIYQSDYYRKERGGMLPIRWMAPESVKDGVFQCSSDVWSYGILLWEISTLGELPYQGYSNEEAGEYIKSGRILPKREGTPDNLHELMLQCWQYNDKMRPTFFDILHTLENTGMLSPNFAKNSFYHEEARQPPDQHETLLPPELEQVSILDEEEDEDDEGDKLSGASGESPRCGTPTRKEGRGAMNGYVTMPVNGTMNGPVCKVTEC
ncbi:insulin-like peptide receptor isoform X2 [Amphiura filiformis]|uniref:insulin-like peptide receptor isoform X2 n=1 Tax=Amphiura filiformis TaxID=82378 RepID=UPI003B2203D4